MFRFRFLFVSATFLMVIAAIAWFKPDAGDFALSKEAMVMRSIGHQILLSAGDSSSRVLPVKKTNDREYEISFEHALTFKTDTLMKIIRQAITANHLTPNYVVNVEDRQSKQTIYGFAVLKSENSDILPCKGRLQPKAHYTIHIKFDNANAGMIDKDDIIKASGGLGALMLIFSGLGLYRRQLKISANYLHSAPVAESPAIAIGQYQFLPDQQYLYWHNEQIKLSDKEFKLLTILARQINLVVDRADLQKVWEDDGVIVGRSLDMFISKLRKKLERDPTVRLVNVHGKGYKLIVE